MQLGFWLTCYRHDFKNSALNAFVDKEERKAIDEAAEKILNENRKLIKSRQNGDEEDTSELNPNLIREMCANRTQEKNAAYLEERETQTGKKRKKIPSRAGVETSSKNRSDDHESLSDDSDDIPPPNKSKSTSKEATKSSKKSDFSDDNDFSGEEISKLTKKRAMAAKVSTSKKNKRQDDSDDDVEYLEAQSSKSPARPTSSRARSMVKKPKYNYDDDDEDDHGDEAPATKSNGRTTSSRTSFTAKRPKYNYDDDDDDIIDDDDYVEETPAEKQNGKNGATKSKAKTASKPAGRGRAGRVNLYNDSDSDDDVPPQTGGWGVANSQASRRR